MGLPLRRLFFLPLGSAMWHCAVQYDTALAMPMSRQLDPCSGGAHWCCHTSMGKVPSAHPDDGAQARI